MSERWKRLPVSVDILDTTLRDGAQAEGISFSVNDKYAVLQALSEMGIRYVEAGNPGSNPKDREFFASVAHNDSLGTTLCAFGSTKRKDKTCEEDAQIQSLLSAGTKTVVIFGKVWANEIAEVLRVSPQDNLEMIQDTIAFFVERNG